MVTYEASAFHCVLVSDFVGEPYFNPKFGKDAIQMRPCIYKIITIVKAKRTKDILIQNFSFSSISKAPLASSRLLRIGVQCTHCCTHCYSLCAYHMKSQEPSLHRVSPRVRYHYPGYHQSPLTYQSSINSPFLFFFNLVLACFHWKVCNYLYFD